MEPMLVEIKQGRPGFDRFIGSWVCQGEINLVVDVGPANSSRRLIEALQTLNVDRVDFVLLTHIHIDHAGGLSDFLEHFPMATVVCHSKGIQHLSDPSRLWAGSRKVLGEVAEFYGALKPVNREKLIPHTEATIKDLEIIETPGHAPHHISFAYQGHLFAGEAGGNYFAIQDREYLRPATPPIFLLEECLNSVDQLLAMGDQPICYGHFGKAQGSHRLLKRFQEQLIRWEEVIKGEMVRDPEQPIESSIESLLENDPELKGFHLMDPDTQKRERFFMTNSINGYLGFLRNKK